ncbi:dienelactone hydrolase family protein [Arthrobacter sp. TB 23]|uniref:dienelactone hydrolase family protein n=2 Tax=unclassified Arthrobacter TaxID=235627 RepID=UPI0002EC8E73|nr:dienelactone hydrolase family protein [Arthrobacter sp. TB 23]
MTDVRIQTAQGIMPASVSVPAVDPPWPGVVITHDFSGMSQDLRDQADWLAAEGFLTVAPDLYYWGNRLACLRIIMRDIGARRGRTFDDIEAARAWLVGQEGCTGVTGVIGFCMGGGYALALAPESHYSAVSTNYGGCPADAAQWLVGACPIVGSYGGRDRSPMGRKAGLRLEGILESVGVEHDIKIYPDAGHGFMNQMNPADSTLLLSFLGAVSGTKYHAAAAQDARRRVVAFFNEHLRSDG